MAAENTIDDVLSALAKVQSIANEVKQSGIPQVQTIAADVSTTTSGVVNDVDFLVGIGETFASIVSSIRNGNLMEAVTTVEKTASTIGEMVKGLKI